MCGAGALIIDGQNRVLLQRRCDNDCWGIPGGAVELGETIEETARREVREETGLTLGEITFFGAYSGPELHYVYPNGDEVHIISHVFVAHEYSGEIVADAAESRDMRFFQLDELPHINPPDQPVIRDFLRKHGGRPARSACPPVLAV
jgi:ADP-ribose pyrophosphatase YjhB (NUDIX family)